MSHSSQEGQQDKGHRTQRASTKKRFSRLPRRSQWATWGHPPQSLRSSGAPPRVGLSPPRQPLSLRVPSSYQALPAKPVPQEMMRAGKDTNRESAPFSFQARSFPGGLEVGVLGECVNTPDYP